MKRLSCLLMFATLPLYSQSNAGELRLHVMDISGHALRTTVSIASRANQYRAALQTNTDGEVDIQRLPYGEYRVEVAVPGFARVSEAIAIRSSIPVAHSIQLKLSTVPDVIDVNASSALTDAERPGSVSQIGRDTLNHRLGSVPGRSLQDMVNSQPDGCTREMPCCIRGGRSIRPSL